MDMESQLQVGAVEVGAMVVQEQKILKQVSVILFHTSVYSQLETNTCSQVIICLLNCNYLSVCFDSQLFIF